MAIYKKVVWNSEHFFTIKKISKWWLGFKPKYTNLFNLITQWSNGRNELPLMTMFCSAFYYARKGSVNSKLDCQEH